MSDAAKAARGAFNDVKAGADEMASGVENASARTEYSMTEARHGVMMLGEEFGVHLPRGLTTPHNLYSFPRPNRRGNGSGLSIPGHHLGRNPPD